MKDNGVWHYAVMTETYQLHEKEGGKLPRNKGGKSTSGKEFEFEDKARVQTDPVPLLSQMISESELNMKRSEKKFKPRAKQISTSSKILKITVKVESKKESEESVNKKADFSPKSKKPPREEGQNRSIR